MSRCGFLSDEEMGTYARDEWHNILHQPIVVRMLHRVVTTLAPLKALLDETEVLLPKVVHLLRRERMSAACNAEIDKRLRWQTGLRRCWIIICVEHSFDLPVE